MKLIILYLLLGTSFGLLLNSIATEQIPDFWKEGEKTRGPILFVTITAVAWPVIVLLIVGSFIANLIKSLTDNNDGPNIGYGY